MSIYLNDILVSARRVLTLLDRNPLGETRGLFTRNFWHFRTTDFPSAADQMGLGILAKLWKLEGTEYYHNPQILNWACAAITSLSKMQKSDGSFDEWYFNERGWAGPTGYIMNAALDTYQELSEVLPPDSKVELLSVIHKGVAFLEKSQEGHMLANHLAIVILPLIQAQQLLKLDHLSPVIESLIKKLEDVWHSDEGWSVEYDGADPGYQSGTLSFLAKALFYVEDERLRNICERSLEFISHFAYPSGAVGGAIGSRHTVTFFCAGIEAFRHSELGARLSQYLAEGFVQGTQVLSSDLDDHYLIYRLYELLDAHFFSLKSERHKSPAKLPWEKDQYRKSFKRGGLEIGVSGNMYWVLALKRGGVIRAEDRQKKEVLLIDAGILASSQKKIFSTLWQGNYSVNTSEDSFSVKGSLVNVTPKLFNPPKLIIFRLFCLLTGFHYLPSLWTKNFIRRLMMVNNKTSGHQFKRTIRISENELIVSTELAPKKFLLQVTIGGEFWTRYVPQSRHFLREHLHYSSPYKMISRVNQSIHAEKVIRCH